ncbi:MAG TPA: ATP-dependent helicase [Deltaproteobacteria bacterium]|nr:ATP-dependent helicase [Deltaproteobacteria bacterium]
MKRYTIRSTIISDDTQLRIDYENELNKQQYDAVRNINGPQLVIAGAGSGKTRALVYRVAYLVEHGVDPRQILLLTFTRKAAREMMHRASSMLDDRCLNVAGGTFHSFAALALRGYAERLGYESSFSIIDRSDGEDIIAMVRSNLGITSKNRRFPKKKTTLDIISKAINTGRSYRDIIWTDYPQFMDAEWDIQEIARRYGRYKVSKSIMDYDDLLVNLRDLLRDHGDVRKRVASQYLYIMVDEYQDTNALQAELIRYLASEYSNIMVVGDDSQSIYSFRGANFKNIMDFPAIFPGCTITTMEQNYRSTQPILLLTNKIIENAKEKYSKKLFSHIKGGQKPVYLRVGSENDQALFICQRALELLNEGIPLNNIAVLFRSGWHSNELEIELNNHQIPYVKYGGLKFIESAHVKDMTSLLRIIFNSSDVIGWYRILRLHEGIGAKTAGDITREIVDNRRGFDALLSPQYAGRKYSDDLNKLYEVINRITSSDHTPAEEVRIVLDYYLPLLEKVHDDYKKRVNDLESLIRIAERYRTIEHFLTDLTIEPPEYIQNGFNGSIGGDGKLILSTVHSAKGLEWHSVFIINLVDGYFPSSYSFYREEDIEEERRLFYVAATRAQQHLYMIVPEIDYSLRGNYSMSRYTVSQPSRFISELDNLNELMEEWSLDFDRSRYQ